MNTSITFTDEQFGNIVPVASETIEGMEKLTCDARALHSFLGVGRDFTNWIKDRIAKYEFIQDVDFILLAKIGEQDSGAWGGHNRVDYALTLDTAKQLAMVENNERGRQIRQYFIACERRAREVNSTLPNFTDPVIAARAWADAQEQKQLAEKRVVALEKKAEADRPKILFANAVTISDTAILVGEMAKLLKQNGVDTGPTRFFAWLRKHDYLLSRGDNWNLPSQRSMELGLFVVSERVIAKPDGSPRIVHTVKITGKGQVYFMNKLVKMETVA